MKLLIQWLLINLTKRAVRLQAPIVIAVTGSVGKTSTRNAIASVLRKDFRVRTNSENYNNEFGVPLTILGETTAGKSPSGWLRILLKAYRLSRRKDPRFPAVLVLEYGADRPGDIAALCDIATPDIGVLTAVSPVHAEAFGNLEELAKEKGEILRRAKRLAVYNTDDARVRGQALSATAGRAGYGFGAEAEVRGTELRIETRTADAYLPGEQFAEMHLTAEAGGESVSANLRDLLGKGQAYAALAALAVGRELGLSFGAMAPRLADIAPQPGRMRPIPGIKGSLILDDSYNAAPASMHAALDVLERFHPSEASRRIAALGRMAELGPYSEEEHRLLGLKAAEIGVDLLVTVGLESEGARAAAIEAGMTEDLCRHFSTSEDAGRYLDAEVKPGDIVLVKGSQSARMEKVAKDLMAEPLRAAELLVRQGEKWTSS